MQGLNLYSLLNQSALPLADGEFAIVWQSKKEGLVVETKKLKLKRALENQNVFCAFSTREL
jgi:hypothetical protein